MTVKSSYVAECLLLVSLALWITCCSVFSEEAPEPLGNFVIVPRTDLDLECSDQAGPRLCTWSTTDTLESLYTGMTEVPPPHQGDPFVDIVLSDSAAVLSLRPLGLDVIPMSLGEAYELTSVFSFNATSGYPTLLIQDSDGLVFYGTSSFIGIEDHPPVVPEGWEFVLETAGFEAQAAFCGVRETPLRAVIRLDTEHIQLVQGETRRIGQYFVRVHAARRVDYSNVTCTDVAVPELSLIIYRAR